MKVPLIAWQNRTLTVPRTIAITAVLVTAVAGSYIWFLVLNRPEVLLTFAVLDVGQGDSLYIESPTGKQVLIDGGPDDAVLVELPKVMQPFDRSIDALIETHPDADHMNGLLSVLKRYEVGAFVEPGIYKYDGVWSSIHEVLRTAQVPRYVARRGMTLDLGGGATLEVLYPDWDPAHMNPKAANNGSIVARLRYGRTSFLLMADVDAEVEKYLAATDPGALKSTILKVGHHGSTYSSDAYFLAEVQPSIAVISVGKRNTFGHPTAEALDRLETVGAAIYRTDQSGTLIFRSDGTKFWQVK